MSGKRLKHDKLQQERVAPFLSLERQISSDLRLEYEEKSNIDRHHRSSKIIGISYVNFDYANFDSPGNAVFS